MDTNIKTLNIILITCKSLSFASFVNNLFTFFSCYVSYPIVARGQCIVSRSACHLLFLFYPTAADVSVVWWL